MKLCKLMEIKLTKDLQHGKKIPSKKYRQMWIHRAIQMMQLDINPHKSHRIIGCKIMCSILIICNNIIIQH